MNLPVTLARRLRLESRQISPAYLFVALWTLAMISVPILGWTLGDAAVRMGVNAGVLLQAAASLIALALAWGWNRTLRVILVVLPAAWLVEFVGSHTGFPFGSYHYTNALQPQLAGVPLLIPLAWLMMLPAAWAVAEAIAGPRPRFRLLGVAALAFTAWDLFLDPQMVAWGYWVWDMPEIQWLGFAGSYFGIPWVNFAGWILSAFLITALVFALAAPAQPCSDSSRRRFLQRPLLVIYTVTWALQSVGLALFWAMPGPAAVGFVAMGGFALFAWRAHLGRQSKSPGHP